MFQWDVDSGTPRLPPHHNFLLISPPVPEVSVQLFCDSVLPHVPPRTLNKFIQASKSAQLPSGRWKAFEVGPSSQTGDERVAFKPLEGIVRAIFRRGREDWSITCEINGDRQRLALRTETSRPDGWFTKGDMTEGDPRWEDIVLCVELKKGRRPLSPRTVHDVSFTPFTLFRLVYAI
jgi:hypothetical protein